ncbi:major facilitator superfamily domain-containing protein 9 [Plutella xylostella]|uniref:major facilitator superfamily domain-containing protein 9 n=1 Tax=Plutella xylostella TaxID=51655 RepID=UPI002032D931|nr:major facilitator superfamily domain-containing protein 9 [Plutella xylostella]
MSRLINIIEAIVFLDLLAVGLIVPHVGNYVRSLGGNHVYVGLLGSIYAIFQLVSGPLVGSLSDIKGRKAVLSITLLASSFGYAMMGLTSSIFVILMCRALLGIFKQTQLLGRALVPDYETDKVRQSVIYGKMAALSSGGMTLGPLISGHIVEDYPQYGFQIIAALVSLCFVINSGLVTLLPNTITQEKPAEKKTGTSSVLQNITVSAKQSFLQLYSVSWSQYWDVFLLKALVSFAMGVYYSNYSVYLQYQYNLGIKYVGYIISFQGTIGFIASYFMGNINALYKTDSDYTQRNFHVFLILSVSIIGIVLSFNVYLYIICLIPLAIGNAIGRLVTLEMILSRSKGEHRGMLIGASNSTRSLTGVVAPMAAGLIGHYLDVTFVIYVSLFSTMLGCVLSYSLTKKAERLKKVK